MQLEPKVNNDLGLYPHTLTLKRQGRDLRIYLDRIKRGITLRNFYSPLRIFKLKRLTFQLQHMLYLCAMDLTITYKGPGVLHAAKKLKDGETLRMV